MHGCCWTLPRLTLDFKRFIYKNLEPNLHFGYENYHSRPIWRENKCSVLFGFVNPEQVIRFVYSCLSESSRDLQSGSPSSTLARLKHRVNNGLENKAIRVGDYHPELQACTQGNGITGKAMALDGYRGAPVHLSQCYVRRNCVLKCVWNRGVALWTTSPPTRRCT